MDNKTINNWIMYHEIKRMLREGHSLSSVAQITGFDRRSVKKYAFMSEAEFTGFLENKESRTKVLTGYEAFVKDCLLDTPAASSAQVHDWLKEHHPQFPKTSAKTVYNFVMAVRHKFNIPLEKPGRDFFIVDQLPYGQQMQADFGQYYMRSKDQGRRKVYFFVMMLSRSRMKYLYFLDKPFTTPLAIVAHESAFKYFMGIPKEVVYDQDRLFLTDENLGELLLTREFGSYVHEQEFELFFCRKADPQSKGKVENVVKYVKNNFLYGRWYYDLETLQAEAMGWLTRTGNGVAHSTTQKVPLLEWEIEKQYLTPWVTVQLLPSYIMRTVRKDNTIAYRGNFYSLPHGTHGRSPEVLVTLKDDELIITGLKQEFICKHIIAAEKGKAIINTDHKRDKSVRIGELIKQTAALFEDPSLATGYFELLRKDKGRYIRDHIQAISHAITGKEKNHVSQVLQKCMEEKRLSATTFKELLLVNPEQDQTEDPAIGRVILLDPSSTKKAEIKPDKSGLGAYEDVFGSA